MDLYAALVVQMLLRRWWWCVVKRCSVKCLMLSFTAVSRQDQESWRERINTCRNGWGRIYICPNWSVSNSHSTRDAVLSLVEHHCICSWKPVIWATWCFFYTHEGLVFGSLIFRSFSWSIWAKCVAVFLGVASSEVRSANWSSKCAMIAFVKSTRWNGKEFHITQECWWAAHWVPWVRRWINHSSLWCMPVWSPFQLQEIPDLQLVPNYTAWWQARVCEQLAQATWGAT